eukprot:TRINITY_DN25421_c0_g1_i1.p1 TRINITY_DN25421_c0_g1~~TRINITY_DN25421_c0_g1_i1.p1  ORF type:complete len:1210 (-),score=226.36 TRINITY_DN25421_c0_g1_i1:61-3585(-)
MLAAGEQQVYGARCRTPAAFRWWGDLVEIACGAGVDRHATTMPSSAACVGGIGGGKEFLRKALQPERLGTFGGVGEIHSGSGSLDAYVVGAPLRHMHVPSLRFWATATARAVALARRHASGSSNSKRCKGAAGEAVLAVAAFGADDESEADVCALLRECIRLSGAQAAVAARSLAVEALDDLACAAARLIHQEAPSPAPSLGGGGSSASAIRESLTSLLMGFSQRLFRALNGHLDLLAEHAAFFARVVALLTRLLASPPHGVALLAPSEAISVLGCDGLSPALKELPQMRDLLQRETPTGLALIRQLVSALRVCAPRLDGRHGYGAATALPPPAASLLAGSAFACGGHAHATLACLSMLLLLVPALRKGPSPPTGCTALALPPSGAAGGAQASTANAFETPALLAELLQVLSDLLGCVAAADRAAGYQAVAAEAAHAEASRGAGGSADETGECSGEAVAGWPARAPVAKPLAQAGASASSALVLVRSPEDALARCVAETKARALDHALRSGVNCLVLTLAERAVAVLGARGGGAYGGGGPVAAALGHASTVVQGVLLPRLLSCDFTVFSPSLDRQRITLGLLAIGARPRFTAPLWDRAVEAGWASQLDAVLAALVAVSQSPGGAVVVAEQRCFAILAYCPLLHASVQPIPASAAAAATAVNATASLQLPAAYAWPSGATPPSAAGSGGGGGLGAWRRPLQCSWCRSLLLVGGMLASAPQLGMEARVFLEAFAPRLRYIFRSGMQRGHMALLEEASAACRLLALLPQRSALTDLLLTDAATQAFMFVVNACLTDRSTASEIFLPVSVAERLGAHLAPDGESCPASVPSVFHQRVEYLGLDFVRNLLVALLRVASSPEWLSQGSAAGAGVTSAPKDAAPKGWVVAASLFGFQANKAAAATGSPADGAAAPLRLWAAIMDVALEGARRVVDILKALHSSESREGVVYASGANVGGKASAPGRETRWIPLSLSLALLEPQASIGGGHTSTRGSPGGLARCLTPPLTPRNAGPLSPTVRPAAHPKDSSGAGGNASTKKAVRYRYMASRADALFGGQLPEGVAPEYVSTADLRRLCSSILEMTCTLLCHFCQATRSSILALASGGGGGAGERSTPAVSVLHGLLSFLHELRTNLGSLGLDSGAVDYLMELDDALRSSQQLGAMPEGDRERRDGSDPWSGD